MPRLRVIFLDQLVGAASSYNVLFWADVPAARQAFYANANAVSAWASATAADNLALQNGSMVEQGIAQSFPAGVSFAQIQTYLQNEWSKYQNAITNYDPWIHYGTNWDGTTWTVGGA